MNRPIFNARDYRPYHRHSFNRVPLNLGRDREIVIWHLLFIIYLFKNSTQYNQYKIEDTIKVVEFKGQRRAVSHLHGECLDVTILTGICGHLF